MAFDMYLNGKRTSIEHHEENLFNKIIEDDRFPQLNWLWENFYNGPIIYPKVSNEIVHELILLKGITEDKIDTSLIEKILPFFSNAYRLDEIIKSQSD